MATACSASGLTLAEQRTSSPASQSRRPIHSIGQASVFATSEPRLTGFYEQIGREGIESWEAGRISRLAPAIRNLLIEFGVAVGEMR